MPLLKKVKQEKFCVAFTAVGAETFGDAAKSAEAAGYSPKAARVTGWRLLQNVAVNDRILELYDKTLRHNKVTVESVLANLQHDRKMARKMGQYNVARACTELEGRYLAMFTDRLATVSPGDAKALTEVQREELEAFARWRTAQLSKPKKDEETKVLPFERPKSEPNVG